MINNKRMNKNVPLHIVLIFLTRPIYYIAMEAYVIHMKSNRLG